jgi:ketosteroid isomerase-like protein
MSTPQEDLLQRYVDHFNRHDVEAVMDCFDRDPAVVNVTGKSHEGRESVRRLYECQFAMFPDGRCELTAVHAQIGNARGFGQSLLQELEALAQSPDRRKA